MRDNNNVQISVHHKHYLLNLYVFMLNLRIPQLNRQRPEVEEQPEVEDTHAGGGRNTPRTWMVRTPKVERERDTEREGLRTLVVVASYCWRR